MPRKPFWLHSKIIHCMYVVFLFFWKKKNWIYNFKLTYCNGKGSHIFSAAFSSTSLNCNKKYPQIFLYFFHSVCRKIKNFLYFFYFFFFFSTLLIWFLFFTLFLSVYNSWAEEQFMYVFVTLKSSHQVLKNVLE